MRSRACGAPNTPLLPVFQYWPPTTGMEGCPSSTSIQKVFQIRWKELPTSLAALYMFQSNGVHHQPPVNELPGGTKPSITKAIWLSPRPRSIRSTHGITPQVVGHIWPWWICGGVCCRHHWGFWQSLTQVYCTSCGTSVWRAPSQTGLETT